MLKQLTPKAFSQYIEKLSALALDLSRTSFPVYTDGVKTQKDLIRALQTGMERENEAVFLFELDGSVEGFLHYYWLENERYIGLCNLTVQKGYAQAMEETLRHWSGRFPGYCWQLYLPEENREGIGFLSSQGKITDSGQEWVEVLLFADYVPLPVPNWAIQIGAEEFSYFRAVHQAVESEMFWTADRIAGELENWAIYGAVENRTCRGAVYYKGKGGRDLEIFGLDQSGGFDAELVLGLLRRCLNDAKAAGARSIYFFTDEKIRRITDELGFSHLTVAHFFQGVCGVAPAN